MIEDLAQAPPPPPSRTQMIASRGGAVLAHPLVCVLAVVLFRNSSIPLPRLLAFGASQLLTGMLAAAALLALVNGREALGDRLDDCFRITHFAGFLILPWLGAQASGETPTKYLMLATMITVVTASAVIAAQFLARRRHYLGSALVLAISYGLSFARAGEWVLSAYTAVWASAAMFLGAMIASMQLNLVRVRNQSQHLADHDGLTGAWTRARLVAELEEVSGGREPHSVVVVDLDAFKQVNDAHGHRAGDAVLVEVVARVRATLGKRARIGRLGGDEFAIIVPGRPESATTTAGLESLVAALAQPVEFEGRSLRLRSSFGVALLVPGADALEALAEADHAMYRAKEMPETTLLISCEEVRTELQATLARESAVGEAMASGEVRFHLQPIVDTDTGRPSSVELLARWIRPDGSQIQTGDLLSAVASAGLVADLGDMAIATAANLLKRWAPDPELGHLAVNINLSALHLGTQLQDTVGEVCRNLPDPSRLVLEVVEDQLFADSQSGVRDLRALRDLGVNIAIDDFGTGYSSLAYLRDLPATELKIDMSFIRGIDQDQKQQAVVGAMVSMVAALEMEVVAEGVETEAEFAVVRALGVDRVQGYLMAKPQPRAAAEETLRRLMRQRSFPPTDPTSETSQTSPLTTFTVPDHLPPSAVDIRKIENS